MHSLDYYRNSGLGLSTSFPDGGASNGIIDSFAGGGGLLSGAATLGISTGLQLIGTGINAWITSARLRGQQKIGATNIANLVERKLQEIKAGYEGSSKTLADWQYATQLQNQMYDFLQGPEGCGNSQMGSAGQRCIEERIGTGAKYPWQTWYSLGPAPEGANTAAASLGFPDVSGGSVASAGLSLTSPLVLLLIAGGLIVLAMTVGGD